MKEVKEFLKALVAFNTIKGSENKESYKTRIL